MNATDGMMISSTHRAVEFKKFLTTIDPQVPDELDDHTIYDNSGGDKNPS